VPVHFTSFLSDRPLEKNYLSSNAEEEEKAEES